MNYTTRGESREANIARGECYICHKTLTKSCILSFKRSGSALNILLYFTLKDLLTEDTPLKFNTLILLNKQFDFFDKKVSIVLPFYNYPRVL